MMTDGLLAIVTGYLLGALPFAYWVAHFTRGMTVRQMGNVGTLTILREVGTAWGITVLVLDAGKGTLAVFAAGWLGLPQFYAYLAGFAAIVGHCWSVFIKFQGGGGAATTLGVLLGIAPRESGIAFILIVVAVLVTSNVRFAAGVSMVFLPLIIWLFGGDISTIIYSVALPLFLVLRNLLKFRRELSTEEGKKKFIIDRDYTPWQTRRKKR